MTAMPFGMTAQAFEGDVDVLVLLLHSYCSIAPTLAVKPHQF